MSITARVIADSVDSHDIDNSITTMVLRYPRFIHAEFMTHRVFSRGASSSRAIPVKKMLRAVIDDPAEPVWWGRNQSGMQARTELTGWRLRAAKALWFLSRYPAVALVWLLSKVDLHKQIANRLLEPWMHIEVIVTSTEWNNFFALRDHPDAQPEMRQLAIAIKQAYYSSTPKVLRNNEWHLPFITPDDRLRVKGYVATDAQSKYPRDLIEEVVLCQMSAARCARVSYLNHEGKVPGIDEDLALYVRLAGNNPKHSGPLEHQAYYAMDFSERLRSNLRAPWVQFRKLIPFENLQ